VNVAWSRMQNLGYTASVENSMGEMRTFASAKVILIVVFL